MFNFVFKKGIWLSVAALILIGGFIYAFNLPNGLFWDDEDWIINNNFVHAISWDNIKFWFTHNTLAGIGLKSNYYRPFLFFTFAFNYILAGAKPLVYHLTSNAIHVFNAVLVFWLIRQIFQRKLLAFLTAVFFLAHPLQTEAVTYISGRGDMLVTMFMLLALLLFYKSEVIHKKGLTFTESYPQKRFNLYRGLSLIFVILGLLSRETGIVFPLLALVFYMAVIWPSRFDLNQSQGRTFLRSIKQGLLKTWPYFAVVMGYGILRLTVLNFLNTLNFYAEPNLYSENIHIRFFTFLPILWEYLKLLLAPVGLHMERGGVVYTSLFQWPVWGMVLALISLLGWLRHLYARGASRRLSFVDYQIWLLGSFWFFIALGPVSGLTPINALMYEHWLYLPMVGFWLIVSFYLVKLFDFLKLKKRPITYSLLLLSLTTYLFFFSYQSIQRNILWGKPIEFYKDILKYEPQSARISNNLGNLYFNQGDKEQAEKYYRQSVEAGDAFAQPYYNLGSILQTRGDIYGAIQLYEQAVQINPNFYYPYQNLAVIYAQQGKLIKAKENIEILKKLVPNNARVYYNSALIYISLNDKKQALLDLKEGIKYVVSDPETGKLIQELIDQLSK